jgi:hypothetical protein
MSTIPFKINYYPTFTWLIFMKLFIDQQTHNNIDIEANKVITLQLNLISPIMQQCRLKYQVRRRH